MRKNILGHGLVKLHFYAMGKHLKAGLKVSEQRTKTLEPESQRFEEIKPEETVFIDTSKSKKGTGSQEVGMHRYSTHLDSHKLVRGWSGSDSAGLHVLVSLLADWLSSACLNIRMEL